MEAVETAVGFVEVQGSHLYYEVAGAGHALVLIHGGWVDSRMWDDQFSRLAGHFRVIRYDLRGHGQSAIGREPYSHVEDLDALLTALGVDAACLLGLSLGGSIAMAYATTHPERVDALILASSSGVQGIPLTDDEQRLFAAPLLAAQRGDRATAIALFVQFLVDGNDRAAGPQVRGRTRAMLMDHTFPQFAPDFPGERWPETASLEHVEAIHSPTLIIVGENDQRVFHRAADVYQACLSKARKVVVPNAAHMVHMDQPEVFLQTVLEFLLAVAPGTASLAHGEIA